MDVPQRLAPSSDDLRRFYVGKTINDLPKPSLVLDRARMQRHCQSLLNAVQVLGVDFRAHVKTHKTREGARLQVGGDKSKQVFLAASTIAEFEHLLPVMQEFQSHGRHVNMLYGIPLPRSQVDRLAAVARQLGPGAVSVLVDHAAQLDHLARFVELAGFAPGVYIKVDTGYHRAGLPPSGINKDDLVSRLMELESQGKASFIGLYSHSSLSYNDSTPKQAMANLEGEIHGCLEALQKNTPLFANCNDKEITISVGASPQVTAVENLLASEDETLSEDAEHLRQTMRSVTAERPGGFRTRLELHAGVYSVLDIQQLSTHSRAQIGDYEEEIALSVVAEVCSVYNNGERAQPEALVSVGVLGLGREPCVAYDGWGVVHCGAYGPARTGPDDGRLVVKRISQEHCIVSWDMNTASRGEGKGGSSLPPIPLEVGQSIRILPNHACVTGALYGWYCVVDSSQDEQRVVDVWTRASGW